MTFTCTEISTRALVVALACSASALPRAAYAEEVQASPLASSSSVSSSSVGATFNSGSGGAVAGSDQGLPFAGWMVYPSFLSGVVFNDNIYQRQVNRVAAVGVRLRPYVEATSDSGLHRTNIYFMADAQIYPGQGQSTYFLPEAIYTPGSSYGFQLAPQTNRPATNIAGRVGANHVWEPMQDLTVRVIADYTRENGVFGSNFGVGGNMLSLQSVSTVSSTQQYANQYSGYVSVEKKFAEPWFIRGTTGIQYVSYDSRPTTPDLFGGSSGNRSLNGLNYTASVRGGVWLTPQIYGFVEPGASLRFYDNSWSDTNGYNVIAGIGSDMISLFRGEIYGGYQRQMSANGNFGGVSGPAFGARILYYPTPYITVTASLDQPLSSAAVQPTVGLFGMPVAGNIQNRQGGAASKTLQARLQADYALSQYWTAYIRGGYGETRWAAPYNLNTGWASGVGLNYNFNRAIALTLEYQFSRTMGTHNFSTFGVLTLPVVYMPGTPSGYTQNILSAGLTYRY